MKKLEALLLVVVGVSLTPSFGDTVTLRDGTRYPNAVVTASSRNGVSFRDQGGKARHFGIGKVQTVEYSPNTSPSLQRRLPTTNNHRHGNSSIYRTIPAGTEVDVRTTEPIDSKTASVGQKFSANLYADVLDSSGVVIIPNGSDAELVIESSAPGSTTHASELVLDMDSLTVSGTRYLVATNDVTRNGNQGLGANRRTAEMVGGGAALGTLIGVLVGHGKGAVIGAGVGAAAGAGGQVLTKGKNVQVPAETVLNFKLERDLRLQAAR
ncbi:MAG: hypothetical protein DMG61_21175 [Acidobacteria bacterium]|nr:MAG: hypothetical protein DMG61_21175 [Acidobacteriota bacterium]